MDNALKDVFQAAAWIVAAGAGLFGIWRAIVEMRYSTDQRNVDLRWRQAETAKKILDELRTDYAARSALMMLDWNGRAYVYEGTATGPVTHDKRRESLRTVNTIFSPEDLATFIRDAFDSLFDHFERIEHFIRIELIRFEDVKEPLSYHVRKLAHSDERPTIENFLKVYEFTQATSFLKRFKEWRSA